MNKIYEWFGGKKWVFTVAAFTVGSVALLLRVNAVILAEWGTFTLGLGGFYFAANVKVKRDNQEFQSAMAGRSMAESSSTSTVSVENKGG